jgi:hypothetical protein|tara:strand:- start:636 stop:869 length:234 start_codon:yes stop_codon:yes gene_type:complete
MKQQLYEMLRSQAIAEQKKALLSLDLLVDHPAGIGDHSTEDYWKNANEALELLVDADDKLACLEKYFPDEHVSRVTT